MNKAVFIIIYTTLEMLNVALAYTVVFQARLRQNKKWIIISCLLGVVLQTSVYILVDDTWESLINLFYWLVIPMFWLERRKVKWFALYPFVWIGTSSLNISASFALAAFQEVPVLKVLELSWEKILCQSVCVVLMLMAMIYRWIRKRQIVEVELRFNQYAVLCIGIFCDFSIVSTTQLISIGKDITPRIKNIYGLAVSISSLVFILLSLWQAISMYRQLEYESRLELQENFAKMQEKQIKRIIEMDEGMRRLRHDMKAHMVAIRAFADKEECGKIQEYLNEMEENSYIREVVSYIGDSAADAVLREYMDRAKVRGIEVEHTINYTIFVNVKSFDLCTIISNLMQNAIEACDKIPLHLQRKICVTIDTVGGFMGIHISNTVAEEVLIEGNRLCTTKENKRKHGMGSQNIRQTVEKYGGEVSYFNEPGWFHARIIIKGM